MRAIDNILEYNLTEREKYYLVTSNIINWCWAKWWVNFDKTIKQNIKIIPWFNKEKWDNLFQDIREVCYEHDIEFRFKKWFLKSNYKFAKKLYKLLRGSKNKWITKKQAFWVSFIAFILLTKYWKEAYE